MVWALSEHKVKLQWHKTLGLKKLYGGAILHFDSADW